MVFPEREDFKNMISFIMSTCYITNHILSIILAEKDWNMPLKSYKYIFKRIFSCQYSLSFQHILIIFE